MACRVAAAAAVVPGQPAVPAARVHLLVPGLLLVVLAVSAPEATAALAAADTWAPAAVAVRTGL
jgi:hypothetical protein